MPLDPNSDRDYVNGYLTKSTQEQVRDYPQFFTKLELVTFRQIRNLTLNFVHPTTVISGTNRSGKTSSLMAIACSHFNFDRQNPTNGNWERATWSSLVKFTEQDKQNENWEYKVGFRTGNRIQEKNGYRKYETKKWGGVAKKESQIGTPKGVHNNGRHVLLIDLNRIIPTRHLSDSYYKKARTAPIQAIENEQEIKEYLSYILESTYEVNEIMDVADAKIFSFKNNNHEYSSFNTASGEDALTNILEQILHEEDYSLILIDEIEIGLHPKIQRRLMDVLYMISRKKHIQFIITTHSYAILDSVPKEARLFIDTSDGNSRVISLPSTYEILTRIDSETFPIATFYVEDKLSKKIVNKAIGEINLVNHGFSRLLKVVDVGSATDTYKYFQLRKSLKDKENMVTKPACILDGDMKDKRDHDGNLQYPEDAGLFFLYSNEAPEKMLVRFYLRNHPNDSLQYHVDNSNCHCLFKKMVELGLVSDENNAFELCFSEFRGSAEGGEHFEILKQFLNVNCQ